MDTIIQAEERFAGHEVEYTVSIEVTVNYSLLVAVFKALVTGKKILIKHTFTENPFLKGAGSNQTGI